MGVHVTIEELSAFELGDMTARYLIDADTGAVGLQLLPTSLDTRVAKTDPSRCRLDRSCTSPWSATRMRRASPKAERCGAHPRTTGSGSTPSGCRRGRRRAHDHHHVDGGQRLPDRASAGLHPGMAHLEVGSTIVNDSAAQLQLELVTSFSPSCAIVEWFGTVQRAVRSARHDAGTRLVSLCGVGRRSFRGLLGAQLAWAGSWQLEISRQHDDVCLSGGLADREFGHWMHTLQPGEELTTPDAIVSCVHGSLDDLCDRLTASHQPALDRQPVVEQDLPVIFNEWCTTWGKPHHDQMIKIADRLAGENIGYLVIDAGWYHSGAAGSDWSNAHGDWTPSPTSFPSGLKATTAAIRERGLIPGLWFEMETVGSTSTAFSLTDRLLQRDGIPITVGTGRFWDLTDERAVDHLSRHVIDLLQECGFGYLKVDYNETIGIGSDHPDDGLGEGLRRQVLASYAFFDRIRARLPQLVIENCSSGGHRLEPSMLQRTAMSSFSDAHELMEIPVIAANLHRLMLPRQSQIWAVLHAADSPQRIVYSLAATFLGRMCLSGDVLDLDEDQWALTRDVCRRAGQATGSAWGTGARRIPAEARSPPWPSTTLPAWSASDRDWPCWPAGRRQASRSRLRRQPRPAHRARGTASGGTSHTVRSRRSPAGERSTAPPAIRAPRPSPPG